MIKNCLFLFFLLGPALAFSLPENAPPLLLEPSFLEPQSLSLKEVLPVKSDPGGGTLKLIREGKEEIYVMGQDYYALATTFRHINLPKTYRSKIKDSTIIQINFGNLQPDNKGKIPEFCNVVLLGKEVFKENRQFPVSTFVSNPGKMKNSISLVLFITPHTNANFTDEHVSQNGFFSKSGMVTLNTKGNPKFINLSHKGKKLRFQKYTMVADLDIKLGIPFNPTQANLKGSIRFPLYIPQGTNSEVFIDDIARQSRANFYKWKG